MTITHQVGQKNDSIYQITKKICVISNDPIVTVILMFSYIENKIHFILYLDHKSSFI